MIFWIYFWVYTFSLVVIWGFFIVAKIHFMKFKNYQPSIESLTNVLRITFIVLSLLWYILIFFGTPKISTYNINKTVKDDKTKVESEISNFNDISDREEYIPENAWDDYY